MRVPTSQYTASRLTLASCFALTFWGCGPGAFDPSDSVSVATLQLSVSVVSELPNDDTRAAIVWERSDPNDPNNVSFFAQDLGPAAHVGVEFALVIPAAPPAEALVGCGDACAHTVGALVLYNDNNRNHTFDLLALTDVHAVDHVLGSIRDDGAGGFYGLDYWSGEHAQAQGFSWVRVSAAGDKERFPIATVEGVSLDGIDKGQRVFCSNNPGKACGCRYLDSARAVSGGDGLCADKPASTLESLRPRF